MNLYAYRVYRQYDLGSVVVAAKDRKEADEFVSARIHDYDTSTTTKFLKQLIGTKATGKKRILFST